MAVMIRCLYCDHQMVHRNPERRPQCSRCQRRGGLVPEEQYQVGLRVAKNLLKEKQQSGASFGRAFGDVADILADKFHGVVITPKVFSQIIRAAEREIELDRRAEEETNKAIRKMEQRSAQKHGA